jgi:DNA-binding PadR family transcriptional regulator
MPERDAIPDGTVLAAVRRAQLHRENRQVGVSLPTIKQHLGLRHTGWTTQQLRPTLDELVAAGLLRYSWRHSRHWWAITPPGKRRASPFSVLPESPQHRKWREARILAEQERERIWTAALDAVEAAEDALTNAKNVKPTSETYLAIAKRVNATFSNMASVAYCLAEWAEPDDRRADVEAPYRALRNTRWQS